ncbi:hypothetical protein KAI46_10600, partial [bacterium]|nr:hypothetical protein [bacterium]
TGGKKALAGPANVPALPRRFPDRRLSYVKSILWQSGHRVAWIKETGRRLCSIAERALACRWGLGICAKKTDKGICASVC